MNIYSREKIINKKWIIICLKSILHTNFEWKNNGNYVY